MRTGRSHLAGGRAGRFGRPCAAARAKRALRVELAWEVLGTVLDPEVPALSVRDLGIVRDVIEHADGLEVVLTPTYSGCPATEVIEHDVLEAIEEAGLGAARVTLQRAPAWTTDWISAEGRRKLSEYGIAPPGPALPDGAFADPLLRPQGERGRRLPALRELAHRAAVGLRRHGVQVALPLRCMPRTLRAFQAHLSP